jgi:hypothetical protein
MIQIITDVEFGVEYHVAATSNFIVANQYGRTEFTTPVKPDDRVLVTQDPFLKVFVNDKEVYAP